MQEAQIKDILEEIVTDYKVTHTKIRNVKIDIMPLKLVIFNIREIMYFMISQIILFIFIMF